MSRYLEQLTIIATKTFKAYTDHLLGKNYKQR